MLVEVLFGLPNLLIGQEQLVLRVLIDAATYTASCSFCRSPYGSQDGQHLASLLVLCCHHELGNDHKLGPGVPGLVKPLAANALANVMPKAADLSLECKQLLLQGFFSCRMGEVLRRMPTGIDIWMVHQNMDGAAGRSIPSFFILA